MPRHPDPDLEERVLKAADGLWKRGGERALTMRAVARAAGTNTPAVYRRFKNREDLIRGLLLRIASRIGQQFEQSQTLEQMAEAYVEFALKMPNEYELFYTARWFNVAAKGARGSATDSRITAELRSHGTTTGEELWRIGGASHANHSRAVGAAAWHVKSAADPIDTGRA